MPDVHTWHVVFGLRFGCGTVIFSHLALTEHSRLAGVHGLREALPVQPGDAVADLEPGILDGRGEPVPGA